MSGDSLGSGLASRDAGESNTSHGFPFGWQSLIMQTGDTTDESVRVPPAQHLRGPNILARLSLVFRPGDCRDSGGMRLAARNPPVLI